MGTMMIEREKSNNRSIPSIQDFPPCIFYSLWVNSSFFSRFGSFYKGQLPGQKWLHSISYQHTHTHLHEYKMFSLTTSTVASAKITSKVRECVIIFVSFGSRGYPRRRFRTPIARFRTIPIVSFLSQDGKKDDFVRGWWEEYFDASFDMRRRERKCGVAFARINTSRARGSRVWWEISSSKHRVSRRKSAVFEFVIDIQSQSGPLSRYLWFRSEKFYYFDDDDADTYVLSLSSLRDNFKQVNFKTSKRVATKARAGFSVNAAAVRFSSSISCFG